MNHVSDPAYLRINIATALDSKYTRYAYVMLTSIFINQPDADIHVYLLHSDLSAQDMAYLRQLADEYSNHVHFLLINKEDFVSFLPINNSWPLEAYYRLMLTDILPPEIDRLLYLDVDVIVDKPIKELYETDFEDNNFCVCRDMAFNEEPCATPFPDIRNELFKNHIAQHFTYFNSGVMLWNITKLRNKYTFSTYMDLAKSLNYQIFAPDQDLLNYLHWNHVKFLNEYQFNLFPKMAYNYGIHYEDVRNETTVVHYAGMKPWEGQYVHYDIEQLWWDYAKQTPFYIELMEEFLHNCIHDPTVPYTLTKLSEEKRALRDELDKTSAMCRKLLQLLEKN